MFVRKKSFPFLTALLATAQVFAGCSHLTKEDLVSNSDYKPSVRAHFNGEHEQAINGFPEKESGGFVTTVEKLWLNLINRTPDVGNAVQSGATLDERTTLRVSREAKSYFYQEAEDGYFPAEHEAILLHVLAGFTFAVEGRRAEAEIEARKASFYLQNEYGSSAIPFDDPALRLWLGSLWLYCGDWQHARVDFRVAASLSKDYAYLKTVADKDQPPEQVSLVLAGSGPQLVWRPSLNLQKVQFATYYKGEDLNLLVTDGSKKQMTKIGKALPTASWYDRHQERDHAIRQALDQSRYMVEAAGTATVAGMTQVLGLALTISMMTLGIGGGFAIFYYGLMSGSEELAKLAGYAGLVVAIGGIAIGQKIYKKTQQTSKQIIAAGMSPVENYRFVRFLPDYVHFSAGARSDGTFQIISQSGKVHDPLYQLSSPNGKTDIRIYFVPGGYYKDTVEDGGANDAVAFKTTTSWIFSRSEVSFKDAFRFCERQSVKTGKKFRIPTESELKRAIVASFGDEKLFDEFSTYGTVWIKAAYVDSFSTCQHFDLGANKQIIGSPCSATRKVICGNLGD